ncbi:uncharacterized protein [Diabrotica undecimpunctata]|uniref:uncharacterized protein n=1 Tax=Diabrotica undecimpunctata TaxID=50387 RepID=UPI003B635734
MKTVQRSARREPGLLAKKRVLYNSVPDTEFEEPLAKRQLINTVPPSIESPPPVCENSIPSAIAPSSPRSVPSSISSPVCKIRDRQRAPSEESVVFVNCRKISEAQRLIFKINNQKKLKTKATVHSAVNENVIQSSTFIKDDILHAAEEAACKHKMVKDREEGFEDISDSEEETPLGENLSSLEDIVDISNYGSPPREKPLTETQVWEKKLLSNSEPSLINVAASALQIPKKVETHHQAFCLNYKGGVVSALEQHAERLQESLNESIKNSELLKKATENILAYAEKIMVAFHEEQIRLSQDINNTKTFLANTVRTDSRDFFNKNAGGDILRCWGMSKPSHPDDPVT